MSAWLGTSNHLVMHYEQQYITRCMIDHFHASCFIHMRNYYMFYRAVCPRLFHISPKPIIHIKSNYNHLPQYRDKEQPLTTKAKGRALAGISEDVVHYVGYPTLHYILYYIIVYHDISYYIMLYDITLHYITIPLHYIMLQYNTIHYITLHYITLRYDMLCYAMLHYNIV